MFVPPFVDLVSSDVEENIRKLREAGVRYPFGKFINMLPLFLTRIHMTIRYIFNDVISSLACRHYKK